MLLMLDTCALIVYIYFVLITENSADTYDWRINVSLTLYGQCMRFRYLSHRRVAKTQASLRSADSPESLLLAYSKYSKYG